MKSNRNLPRTAEEQTIITSARRDARRGTLAGALAGATAGRFLRKRRLAGAAAGAIAGGLVGHAVGRQEGLRSGARDVLAARRALRSDLAEMHTRLVELEERSDNRDQAQMLKRARAMIAQKHGAETAAALTDDDVLDLLDQENDSPDLPTRETISRLPGCYSDDRRTLDFTDRMADDADGNDWRATAAGSRDRLGNANETRTGQQFPSKFDVSGLRREIAARFGWAIAQSLPDDELSMENAARLSAMIGQKLRDGDAGGRHSIDPAEARRNLARVVGHQALERMTDAEVMLHARHAADNGMIEFEGQEETTDFYSDRPRNGQGEFVDDQPSNNVGAQRAYSPGPQRRTGRTVAEAAGGAAVLGAALLAHRRLRKMRTPMLHTRTIDANPDALKDFSRRTMSPSPFGGPRKLIRRPRRGGKLLARLRGFGAGSLAAGLLDGAIDAVGIGSATNPKKKKVKYDADGNPIIPLQDPPTTATSSFSVASKVARTASPFARDAGVIAGADLLAERANAAIERRRKQRKRGDGEVQATPGLGGAPQTMASVHAVLNEFADGSRERARRRAAELGGAGAGGVAGAAAGAFHDQGKPVGARDLRPGDQVYRRKGPLGVYQHTGVVDETGERIVHRTKGSSVSRSVKPDTFMRGGRGPLRRESHGDDLPSGKRARNASAAAGARQGKYSLVGENCQHATSRISSKGAPASRQLRKVAGGATGGALIGGALAALIARRRKEKNNE